MRLSVTCPEDCSNFLGRSKPPASPSRLCFSSLANRKATEPEPRDNFNPNP